MSKYSNDSANFSYSFDEFDETLDNRLPPPRVTSNRDDVKKVLVSHADISQYWKKGQAIDTTISRDLIARIARSSETVDAILRRATDDVVGTDIIIEPKKGIKNPSEEQHKKLEEFFDIPNKDDQGDEWLSDMVYDYFLFGDAFLEKGGSLDEEEEKNNITEAWYGGDLEGIWHIPCETMKIIHVNETGELPDLESGELVYQQNNDDGSKIKFDGRKIIRISRFRRGRMYGQSPLLSLFNIIAGQINLTGYIGNLFKGNVPKHLLNLGDISDENYDRLMHSIQEQLEQATNPFGVIAINVPQGFELQRLMETNREGAFLDTLDYYRQEICSVFGIPPTKMSWSTPGRIGNPEEMLDSWYDTVEQIQNRLAKMLNRAVLPELETTDWIVKFKSPRPKKTRLEAQALRDQNVGYRMMRQEHGLSINEWRIHVGLERIEKDWADDPQYASPMIKNPGGAGTPHAMLDADQAQMWDIIDSLNATIVDLKKSINEIKNKGDK